MQGLSRLTAEVLDPDAHLAQSIIDILSTPKGTRVMRRDYGSDLPDLIDRPINGETLIDLYQATAEALNLWEPRVRVARVAITEAVAGSLTIELDLDTDNGRTTIAAEIRAAA